MNYYCTKFYTNISTNMDTTNIFQFLSIFAQNFYYLSPKKSNFGPKNNYAKFHAFISQKVNDWCNFP